MGYVFSTVSYNLMCVTGFLAVDLFIKPLYGSLTTEILDAFNYNSLPLFLLVHPSTAVLVLFSSSQSSNENPKTNKQKANVLTGLTNLSMKTIDASEIIGYAVLGTYMTVVSSVAFFLRHHLIKLRL